MLQVSMPVIDGLLPSPCNTIVLDLLFTLCTWHAYAKLRIHTSGTIASLSASTSTLGTLLRRFRSQVCSLYATKELPREEAARGRRTAALTAKGQGKRRAANEPTPTTSKPKLFNMLTYKLHALGDYVAAIIAFGPSDNYSTQVVSHISRPYALSR